jgi:precorrin-6A/cobalt-precorrin-6A reductase
MRPTILVLGGTTQATALARALSDGGYDAVFSYAGRVEHPKAQPLPTRIGGFGGVDGLVDYLHDHHITHVIDATHPFAAQMSRNAVEACTKANVALIALTRPEWSAQPGDRWTHVPDMAGAVAALDRAACRVMLAIGKQHVAEFAVRSEHYFLLRMIEQTEATKLFSNSDVVIAKGPFDLAGDLALMRAHNINVLVSKNAGGAAARAKIDAAREIGIEVIMIDRPKLPERTVVSAAADALDWIG